MLYGGKKKPMSRASTFLMGGKKGGEKQPMSRASTFFMGEKETQNSFPEFLVQAHKKSKIKIHPGPGRATCKCKYILSTSLVRASTCWSLLAGLGLRRLLARNNTC